MALNDPYATRAELETRLRGEFETSAAFNTVELDDALATASRGIESVCQRQFNKVTSATARLFYPDTCGRVEVSDFHTTTGLLVDVDDAGDGTYSTSWVAADYELHPLDGIVDDQPGWPFNEILAVGSREFSLTYRRAPIRVTAQWGWAAVPLPVKTSCLIAAVEIWKLKDAPFGVAGVGEWGTLRVRENPMIMAKLRPYIREPLLIA